MTWVKNYIGALSPDHEYYRNQSKKTDGNIYLKASYDLTGGLSAYADLQYRHIDYTIDGANDKYDWNKSALRPLAVDKKFDFFNPKVGLNWNINSNHRVYASFSVAQKSRQEIIIRMVIPTVIRKLKSCSTTKPDTHSPIIG